MAYLPRGRELLQHASHAWVLPVHAIHKRWLALLARIPADCPLCGGRALGGRLCSGCLADVTASADSNLRRCRVCALDLTAYAHCPDCTFRVPAFERVWAAFDYMPPGDLLIHRYKVERRFALARMLAEILVRRLRNAGAALPRHTIVVPVPASSASIRLRGFNPAAEIARCLAQQLQLACRPDLLLRVHEGVRQTYLTRAERARGTGDLYACSGRVEQASIAVVDDVLTTGSTLDSIARQFKAAGAASVYGLVLARTPYRR